MYIRRKKNRSGTISVVIVDKSDGYKELHTVGVSSDPDEIEKLILQGQEWISRYKGQHTLDFNNQVLSEQQIHQFFEQIDNVLINGT